MPPITSRKIQEGFDLLNYFYKLDDEEMHSVQQETFRQDTYRLVALHFHLAIEELLKAVVFRSLPNRRTLTAKQNIKYVQDLSSKDTIYLAARIGVINKRGLEALLELNKVRNKCSHNWMLNGYTIARKPNTSKGIKQQRNYKVMFNGKNLLNLGVMKYEFMPLYSDIYLELFAVNFGIRWKRKYTNY